jgi:release factor glutamine methyltransferase
MTVIADDPLSNAVGRLTVAGIPNPQREARLLQALAENDAARFADYVRRRAAHEPYSRIRGAREFWSLDLVLSRDTLDPRPDSETLIEAALAALPDRDATFCIVDFGTGTGALLLALLTEYEHAVGVGIDILAGAVATARQNAARLGLAGRARFVAGDWAEVDLDPADVILANPPYIPSAEIEALSPEVAEFDPRRAIDGGPDGLDCYRSLAPVLRRMLRPGGWAFLELGSGQTTMVRQIMRETGLKPAEARRDLAGHERCLVLRQADFGSGGPERLKNRLASAGIPSRVMPPKAKEPRAPRRRRTTAPFSNDRRQDAARELLIMSCWIRGKAVKARSNCKR